MKPVVGLEMEFFSKSNLSEITEMLSVYSDYVDIAEEYFPDQFEVIFKETANIEELICRTEIIKTFLSHNALAFSLKSPDNNVHNSIHINVSIADRNEENITHNDHIFLPAIGGILDVIPISMHHFAPNESTRMRYHNPNIHTPSTVSWGFNNRSTAIRIPVSKRNHKLFRIENRIPCIDCNLEESIWITLYGIINGIHHKYNPPKPIYGIAHDLQYGLTKLADLNYHDHESIFNKIKHTNSEIT